MMKRDVHALPVLLVFVLLISLSTAVEVSATTPRHARHLRSTGTSPLTVTFCLSGVKGVGLTMPSSSNYNKARLSYNLRTQAYPAFMVYVKTVNQVSQVVKCANTHGYRVVPRGGGASFEGYSSQSGTVVLDMDIKSFGGITLSKDKKTAMVSAGAQLKDVYTTLWEAGRYVTPGGTVGLVGFSGCALGGCFGFLTRKYGMACDNVVEVQAVLANGKIVRANSAKDADLLWASRGGGGGQYAIITQFKMKVYQQPTGSTATSVSYTWDLNKATAVKGLAWYQNSVQKLPNEYSGAFSVQGDKGGRVTLTGIFLGKTKDQTKAAFAAAGLFAALGHPNKDASYFNTVRSALGYTYVPPAKYFKSKSTMQINKYSAEALDIIADAIIKGQSTLLSVGADVEWQLQLHPLGGAVSKLKPSDTAFPWRSTGVFNSKLRVAWATPSHSKAPLAWLAEIAKQLAPLEDATAYSNYIDEELGEDSGRRYFGTNLNRLRAVKKKYDPKNLFRFPFSVSP